MDTRGSGVSAEQAVINGALLVDQSAGGVQVLSSVFLGHQISGGYVCGDFVGIAQYQQLTDPIDRRIFSESLCKLFLQRYRFFTKPINDPTLDPLDRELMAQLYPIFEEAYRNPSGYFIKNQKNDFLDALMIIRAPSSLKLLAEEAQSDQSVFMTLERKCNDPEVAKILAGLFAKSISSWEQRDKNYGLIFIRLEILDKMRTKSWTTDPAYLPSVYRYVIKGENLDETQNLLNWMMLVGREAVPYLSKLIVAQDLNIDYSLRICAIQELVRSGLPEAYAVLDDIVQGKYVLPKPDKEKYTSSPLDELIIYQVAHHPGESAHQQLLHWLINLQVYPARARELIVYEASHLQDGETPYKNPVYIPILKALNAVRLAASETNHVRSEARSSFANIASDYHITNHIGAHFADWSEGEQFLLLETIFSQTKLDQYNNSSSLYESLKKSGQLTRLSSFIKRKLEHELVELVRKDELHYLDEAALFNDVNLSQEFKANLSQIVVESYLKKSVTMQNLLKNRDYSLETIRTILATLAEYESETPGQLETDLEALILNPNYDESIRVTAVDVLSRRLALNPNNERAKMILRRLASLPKAVSERIQKAVEGLPANQNGAP